ncbi:unnamed protein product [Cuscuta epithymum]|uniref:Uncharacterized protein n=1 Tax=Cuscuta epithymum TaxID=186058 RepID=A0AAV0EY93_9ASTE|nr:unnamed protein product [Cuscuta epithymum]
MPEALNKASNKAKMIKIWKLLPKSVAMSSFPQSLRPLFSPGGGHRHSNERTEAADHHHLTKMTTIHCKKGFSGPIVSIIPPDARRKPSTQQQRHGEPTSPKVSCIGQIKRHKSKKKQEDKSSSSSGGDKEDFGRWSLTTIKQPFKEKPSSSYSLVRKHVLFHGRKSDASADKPPPMSLGQIKRFASGREISMLSEFTCPTQQQLQAQASTGIVYCSDEEEEDQETTTSPPTKPPLQRQEPRKKEINLWKRRIMAQPKPLHIIH